MPFVAGLLFAIGLGIGGMTDPGKVIGFLDVLGDWDPSLAFVMAGALAAHLPFVQLWRRRGLLRVEPGAPDWPLVAGAALFGIGWGLSGLCPGPAFVSLARGGTGIVVFVICLLLGTVAARWLRRGTS